jgi:hypothetical protein
MATIYKTPGVYIEEIPKLPPSVAQVETAIPAFIGYTQQADRIAKNDLHNVPTKISSLVEYELYFGVAPATAIEKVNVDVNGNFKSAILTGKYFMYESLRLFYANGGGDCYIVSVGLYNDPVAKSAFLDGANGLRAIAKEDEPTLLVFPDNDLFSAGQDYYEIYQQALLQCESLGDRFVVMDVKRNDYLGNDFRSSIGMTALKYGAAYTPWLIVKSAKEIRYSDFKNNSAAPGNLVFLKEGTPITLLGLVNSNTDPKIIAQINKLEKAIEDTKKITGSFDALNTTFNSLAERYNAVESNAQSTPNAANLQSLMSVLFSVARVVDVLAGGTAESVSNENNLKAVIGNQIALLKPNFERLIGYEQEAAAADGLTEAYDPAFDDDSIPSHANWGAIFSGPAAASEVLIDADDDASKVRTLLPLMRQEFDTLNSIISTGILNAAIAAEKELDKGLVVLFPTYKNIIEGIQNTFTIVPPCGAVTGIYAFTDRTRGVWKAPANASVLSIIGPDRTFKLSELDALNVDTTAGKSINAIRSFTGKGTLVFGARTLAGNDNEWRYVSVRRFFNMVEESSKKATEPFVFEPNDANTWVKVQGMLENYLTTLWRQGALQGAKPEHAFYVAVGLGKTMTALDILEGRMIVEIGMAVVRPAEFIILRFSHKLAES